MFNIGQSVKFVSEVADKVIPNTEMVVAEKPSWARPTDKTDCVWVKFGGLPALDNYRLVPVSMLETM